MLFFIASICNCLGAAHEQTPNRNQNSNNIRIIFEDTVDSENNSNYLNCSADSRPQTSPIANDHDDSGNGASNCESPTTATHNLDAKPKPLRNKSPVRRPNVPNVVLAGKLYEQRRKERMQQIVRVEREQRQFHAKKVPNFNSIHAAQSAKRPTDEPKFTIPVTPKVVHHHRKNLERIRIKVSSIALMFGAIRSRDSFASKRIKFYLFPIAGRGRGGTPAQTIRGQTCRCAHTAAICATANP